MFRALPVIFCTHLCPLVSDRDFLPLWYFPAFIIVCPATDWFHLFSLTSCLNSPCRPLSVCLVPCIVVYVKSDHPVGRYFHVRFELSLRYYFLSSLRVTFVCFLISSWRALFVCSLENKYFCHCGVVDATGFSLVREDSGGGFSVLYFANHMVHTHLYTISRYIHNPHGYCRRARLWLRGTSCVQPPVLGPARYCVKKGESD